jgi:hypothetical protein
VHPSRIVSNRLPYPALFTLFFAAVGCSSSTSGDTPPADTGTGTTDTKVGGGTDTSGDTPADEDCSEAVEDRPPLSACVRHVTGKAVDVAGKPLADLVVSVCGGVCYFSKTIADGTFDAHIGRFINHTQFSVLVHGRPKYASLYDALPAPGSGDLINIATPIMVPAYDAIGDVLPADGSPAGSATAGAITVSWPAATEFDLDVEDVADKETGRTMKSAKWTDLTKVPTFATGKGFLSLYALAPFDMKTCTKRPCESTNLVKLSVTITNETGLPAGTAVELLVLDTDLFSVPFTAGTAKVAATGKVSADGKTITTDPGQGLTSLTWIGVRKKA